MIVAILGRQPQIGLAELESLLGKDSVQPINKQSALIQKNTKNLKQSQLGGTIKLAETITTIPSNKWNQITDNCINLITEYVQNLSEGKVTLGLSTYGIKTTAQNVNKLALQLKKNIRKDGRPVRIVPNKKNELNSAQILHNKLTSPLGIEIIITSDKNKTYIAKTLSVQDIENYSLRDFDRPKRDAFVGMLPPKLAQIIINLAKPNPNSIILDPFCGTGVLLMEASLQGYSVMGSDLNPKMIEYTKINLEWLKQTYKTDSKIISLTEADATKYKWPQKPDTVACETYLGRPLSKIPEKATLDKIIKDCNQITSKFLINLHSQLEKNSRCCIAIPSWNINGHFKHLPFVDDLKKIGYNRVSFSHVSDKELIYYRSNQIVARELLVLTRL